VEDKLKRLEVLESSLVEKLGLTQQTQKKALDNLNSVIQICNLEPVAARLDRGGKRKLLASKVMMTM
jgi:hypothetical protein